MEHLFLTREELDFLNISLYSIFYGSFLFRNNLLGNYYYSYLVGFLNNGATYLLLDNTEIFLSSLLNFGFLLLVFITGSY